jgi:hypothetical protein
MNKSANCAAALERHGDEALNCGPSSQRPALERARTVAERLQAIVIVWVLSLTFGLSKTASDAHVAGLK